MPVRRIALLVAVLGTWAHADSAAVDISTPAVIPSNAVVVSTPAGIPRAWRSVPNDAFDGDEDFFFTVRWGVVTGGNSTLAITGIDMVEGRPAYHIVSEAHSTGIVDTFYSVHDRNDAWLDAGSMTTVRYEKRIHEGKYRVENTVVMDQVQGQFRDHSYRADKDSYEDKIGDLPPNALDVLGSLYYVRTLPLEVGKSFTIDVYSGGQVYPLVVKVLKREKISVPAGKFDCWRVEPLLREPGIFVSKGKKLEVWLTADQYRLPVRMRSEVVIGHVSAELVSFHRVEKPSQVR